MTLPACSARVCQCKWSAGDNDDDSGGGGGGREWDGITGGKIVGTTPRLKCLSLSGCHLVTDAGLR